MAHFPHYLNSTEANIINAMLTRVLAAGHYVAVHDGEEMSLRPTRDRADIQRETAATEMTTFIIYDPSEKEAGKWRRRGSIVAIHGNEEDVLSDAGAPNEAELAYIESLAWPE